MARAQALPRNILILGATSAIAQARRAACWLSRARVFFWSHVTPASCRLFLTICGLRGATAVSALALDLDDLDGHAAMLTSAAQTLGSIDLALLAHGVLGDQAAAEADARVAEAVYRTNFLSPASLMTWLANYFERRGQGCLAVISSVAGDRGSQEQLRLRGV